MQTLALLFFFCLGTLVGSFLNVVILRFGARTLRGRSHCFSCGAQLRWFYLVPLVSFALLRGRCSACRARISWQYPLVELVTGLLFALTFYRLLYLPFGKPLLLFSLTLECLFIVIAVYDLRHRIIPEKTIYLIILLSSLFFCAEIIVHGFRPYWWLDLAGAALLPLPFALLWFISKGRMMGLGDAKLVVSFSLLLGFVKGLSALAVGFWIGALGALVLLLLRPKRFTMKTELPLAPFLLLGLFIVFLTGVDVTGLSLLL